jgi:hypothetical protein
VKKTITVHGWVQDNLGTYHQPGCTLTIDDDGTEGCITAEHAQQLRDLGADRPRETAAVDATGEPVGEAVDAAD